MASEATAFILERLAKALTDDGIGRDIVDAVLPTSRDFLDLRPAPKPCRLRARADSWEDLVTVYTRPANLAKKLPAGAVPAAGEALGGLQPSLFQTEAERTLMGEWWQAAGEAGIAVEKRDYGEALGHPGAAAPLRGQVLRRRAGDGRRRGGEAEPAAATGGGGGLGEEDRAWLEYLQG